VNVLDQQIRSEKKILSRARPENGAIIADSKDETLTAAEPGSCSYPSHEIEFRGNHPIRKYDTALVRLQQS
jgi:hypothetical protein